MEARSLQALYLVLPPGLVLLPGLVLETNALETGLYRGFQDFVDSGAEAAGFGPEIVLVLAHETYRENRLVASFAEEILLWQTRVKSANDWRYAQAVMEED